MKRIFTSAMLLLSGLVPGGCAVEPAFADSAVSPIVQIGEITSYDGDFKAVCSGFYIGGGLIVSAGHCAPGPSDISGVTFGASKPARVVTIIESDPAGGNPDYSVQRIVGSVDGALPQAVSLDCGTNLLPIGMPILVKGFPEDLGYMEVAGEIASAPSPWGPWKIPVYRTALSLSYGDSGSGVFAADGNVVGIAVGVLPNNRSLSIMQPIAPVCAAIAAWKQTLLG